jgi:hypothetical protein
MGRRAYFQQPQPRKNNRAARMTRPRSAWLGALNLTQFALDMAELAIILLSVAAIVLGLASIFAA